jgi:hypothetical protein
MDSHYIDASVEDSRQSRSRSNSHLTRATSKFQDLNIKSTIASTESGGGTSTEGPTTSTPSFLDPNSHPASTYTSSPTEQYPPPFPQFSQNEIDAQWPSLAGRSSTTPLLRLDPAEQLPTDPPSHSHPSISRSNSYPVNMRYVNRPILQFAANHPPAPLGFSSMIPGLIPVYARRIRGLVSCASLPLVGTILTS